MNVSAQSGAVRGASDNGTPALSPSALATDRWCAWDSFVGATPETGFMQTSWWADFRATHGYGHFLLMLKEDSEIVGGALVLRFDYSNDSCFYLVPEGPVLPRDEWMASRVFEAILNAILQKRAEEERTVSHLRIEPRLQSLPAFLSGFEAPPFVDRYTEPRNTLCIDLRDSTDDILARMKPKGRYNIRLAGRRGVSIVADTSRHGLLDFFAIYEDTAERQGMDAKPRDYFEELTSMLLDRRCGSMYFAEYGGRRLAAALVVFHGRRATYFFGGSLSTHRDVMAPYALHFEIMRRAKAMGCEWYDLWGVAPADEPDHPWQGLSAFKRKFGGVEVDLVPTLDYVFDRESYDRFLCSERGR